MMNGRGGVVAGSDSGAVDMERQSEKERSGRHWLEWKDNFEANSTK